jgi:hypothetical protein
MSSRPTEQELEASPQKQGPVKVEGMVAGPSTEVKNTPKFASSELRPRNIRGPPEKWAQNGSKVEVSMATSRARARIRGLPS